jgi:hypothetical protein
MEAAQVQCQFISIRQLPLSALNHALDALVGRRDGWPDLLSMVGLPNRIGPHDLRRSLSTSFENIGLGAYASALLDHRVTGVDAMSREVAAVTQAVYSAADRVLLKSEALSMWLEAVLPAYEAAKSDFRIAKAVEARKLSLAGAAVEQVGGKQPVDNTRVIPDAQRKVGRFAS